MQENLFDDPSDSAMSWGVSQRLEAEMSAGRRAPRVRTPNRSQIELRPVDLESLLGPGHRARTVWDFVVGLDLSELYQTIEAVEGGPGRAATDPRVLLSLWLYATVEGVGSARALDRLTREHDGYRWICGGLSMNYHTLADFRVAHVEFLDELLTTSVASMMVEGLVDLHRVAQDGVRIRASAGASSFRRKPTLEECLRDSEEQIEVLRRELDEDRWPTSRRKKAARLRAAAQRLERVQRALAQMPEAEAKKKTAEKDKARISTTDPDARVMKMADGGFRPAFNGQLAVDTATQVIVGIDLTNRGSDLAEMTPMLEQLVRRHGRLPEEFLADGGFANHKEIEKASRLGAVVYAPVSKPKDPTRERYEPMPGDSRAIADWRQRMGTEGAKEIYKDRAATVECVNAHLRNRGLLRFLVRGKRKARAVLLLHALAQNLMRATALRSLALETA